MNTPIHKTLKHERFRSITN